MYYVNMGTRILEFDSIINARAKIVKCIKDHTPVDKRVYLNKACSNWEGTVEYADHILNAFTDKGDVVSRPFVWRYYNYIYVLKPNGRLDGHLVR